MNSHEGYAHYADCSGLYKVKPHTYSVTSCFRFPTGRVKCTLPKQIFWQSNNVSSRFQWPLGLKYRSMVARLQGFRIRIQPEAWMSVSCECCVLSARGLCVGLVTRPEKAYRVSCVCDRETSLMRGCCAIKILSGSQKLSSYGM